MSATGPSWPGHPVVLAAAGVSLVLAPQAEGLPEVLHWGADLGPLGHGELDQFRFARERGVSASALDEPWPFTLAPGEGDGWAGAPGLLLDRDGGPIRPRWRVEGFSVTSTAVTVTARSTGLVLKTDLLLDAHGVLRVRHRVRNEGVASVRVVVADTVLPLDDRATELLDFTGRWTRERVPQRRPRTQGTLVRESRRGRTGHDSPTLLVAGTPGFGDRHGELWAVHLAWSGDARYRVDDLPEGRVAIGVGELLRPGEVELAAGETFQTPDGVFVWSDRGLDGVSARLHASLRDRPHHPVSARPVVLNTWEAVYFDHDLPTLHRLADIAADIGVERFVLDDGWFRGRRDDRAGLGDWVVDEQVWPDGLHPLVDHVRGLGMEFGLWVEPEMVNLDSDLAREHPDWLLTPDADRARTMRHQHVLDLALPEVREHLLKHLSALLDEYDIAYLKWDQNRDLLEATHLGRAGVDGQVRALYDLLDTLRARYPALEIESCASGGARVDLGVVERTDRVWASDSNDPVERARLQRWTELLVPPELIGSHVGPPRSHTSGRHADLGFRIATTLFASPGLEWDLTACGPHELDVLTGWIGFYRGVRPTLHAGELVHDTPTDGGALLTGAVAPDRAHAVYRLSRTDSGDRAVPPPIRLPGLDPTRRYRVRVVDELPAPRLLDVRPPAWLAAGETTATGRVLAEAGLAAPLLAPAQALVLELTALDGGT
ncbi:alpha-galactosidase [Saccharothrix saharensis]|uniref:alpha-galactosidase n=1 Tax=Saccharothrix saharensis TaxID=571190 RepID=UPI0036CF7870